MIFLIIAITAICYFLIKNKTSKIVFASLTLVGLLFVAYSIITADMMPIKKVPTTVTETKVVGEKVFYKENGKFIQTNNNFQKNFTWKSSNESIEAEKITYSDKIKEPVVKLQTYEVTSYKLNYSMFLQKSVKDKTKYVTTTTLTLPLN